MKTYALEHVLRKRLAYVPGSISNIGRLVLVVSLEPPSLNLETPTPVLRHPQKSPRNDPQQHVTQLPAMQFMETSVPTGTDVELTDDLAVTLNYYAQLFRFNEILEFNVLAVIDNRCGNWKRLRFALRLIKTFLPQIAVALVVKSDNVSTPLSVKLWLSRTRPLPRRAALTLCGGKSAVVDSDFNEPGMQMQRSNTSSTANAMTMRPSTVLIVGKSKMTTYIDVGQLPAELGGHFDFYNHSSWLISRIAAERFVDRVEYLITHRFASEEETSKNSIGDWKVRHLLNSDHEDIEALTELANKVSTNLGKHSAASLNSDLMYSVKMALSSLEPLAIVNSFAKQSKPKNFKLPTSTNEVNQVSDLPLNADEIQHEIDLIRKWLSSDGDRLIICETSVGTNLKVAERLVDKHELLELDCAETFARYARVIATMDILKSVRQLDPALLVQRAELDSAIRTFAMRIDRRRTLLLTSARYFRLLKKSATAVNGVFRLLSASSGASDEADDGVAGCSLTEKQQIELETHKGRAEILGSKALEEGARLIQMLASGTGRPDVVRDYSKEIGVVLKTSETLALDLEAMEQIFTTPVQSTEPNIVNIDEEGDQKTLSTDSLEATSATCSASSTSSTPSSGLGRDVATDAKSQQIVEVKTKRKRKTVKKKSKLDRMIFDFARKIDRQLSAMNDFVDKFFSELKSPSSQRLVLAKYQPIFDNLEAQWSLLNSCGLDFVGKIIRSNGDVDAQSVSLIENGMLELNRQFSQIRTLWKDIQINKVQAEIVHLIEMSSKSNASPYNSPRQSSPDDGVEFSPKSTSKPRQDFHNQPPKMKRCFTSSDVTQLSPVDEMDPEPEAFHVVGTTRWLSNPELHLGSLV